MDGIVRTSRHRPLIALFLIGLALAGLAACQSKQAKEIEARGAALDSSLAALAETGDTTAMQLVADIEVLRAQAMFPDSVANALAAMPSTAFLHMDAKGEVGRVERGLEITQLLEFSTNAAQLIKDGVITGADADEVRRLAADNLSAAADKARELKSRRGSGLP